MYCSTKMPHNINFREKKIKLRKDKKADGVAGEDALSVRSRVARFRYFEDISGYSGVRTCDCLRNIYGALEALGLSVFNLRH